MKKLLYLTTVIIFVFIIQSVSAQRNSLNHTLKQGETLSALAKQYNTNVGDIMRLNNMHADTKLVYGSVIKIPSNLPAGRQAKNIKVTSENIKPVATNVPANAAKHTVIKGETLYSISKEYNVSTDDLKTWNKLSDNSVKPGNILIVGNNEGSAELNKPVTDAKRQRVETTEQNNTLPVTKPEQKIENNVVAEKTENNSEVKTNSQAASVPVDNVASTSPLSQSGEGFFADSFKKSRKQQHVSGTSKTFKTASGWNDGKYYILADDINPGTIVKLTAGNGNSVYAKVLWSMGDLKENSGANFRISNATAAALNENASSFSLDIYY